MTEHKISVWGAPGSGKTTFLAALNIAMMRSTLDWAVVAKSGASSDWLTRMTDQLVRGRDFPEVTVAPATLDFVLVGPPRTKRRGRFFRRPAVTGPTHVDLSLVDLPGGSFGSAPAGDLMEDLTVSDGFLFLFDPIREFDSGDSFEYFYRVVIALTQRVMASDAAPARLPHRLAVCITKFDDVRVLETAERLGLLTTDPDDPRQVPRVESESAQELFTALCANSASGNGDMLLRMIMQFFRPEHVRFFATSAIGFHVDPVRKTYDPDDFQNVVPTPAGHRIRGPVRPINVVEPILWLADQPAADIT
ncbi:hypothetical protein [Nonomuraea sp. NPDC002799]